MSLPDPPTSLDGSCSVIHDGTLYSYSPAGFLSLSLSAGAEWETLTPGETVTGAVCVDASNAGVLWVVGGTGSDAYTGLQKFTYSTGEWTTVTPSSLVSKNLKFHGATYIQDSDAILIYAGSYDGTQTASADTWTIQASEPYNIKSYNPSSHKAIKPILLNWGTAEACLVGGDTGNTAVPIFNYNNGWREFSTLAEPLAKDSSSMQAVIVAGSDNSKSLLTFDLSTSPNEVRRFVIQGEDGGAVVNAAAVSKRDLTISDWPKYNSTLAPTAIRTGYAIAQGDGTVVFSGGNTDEPIAMFDYNENAWLNATQELTVAAQKIESESSSTSSSTKTKTSKTKSASTSTKLHTQTSDASSTFATSTVSSTATGSLTLSDASASATSTDAAAAAGGSSDDKGGLSSNVVLGVTLGSICGFLAILILLLLCMRRRKKANKPIDHSRGLSSDEKAPMVFHNAPPPISEPGHLIGHNSTMSQESFSSMAILMGRAGKPKQSGLSRKPSHDTTRSSVSTLHKQLKATIGKPVLQEMQHPALQNEPRGVAFDPNVAEPRPRQPGQMETEDGMRRSSGWNRYWSGGSALQILGFGGPKRATGVSDDQSSHYSQSTHNPPRNPRVTQDSATVPPLNFDFRPEFNRVNSGSPVVEKYGKIPFTEGVAGKIERPSSKVSSSGYSSGIPESVNDQWESHQSAKPWGAERATSSVYNPSFYFGTPLSPGLPPPKNHPSGVSNQPQLAMASTSSDMSWLNLGDRQQRV